MADETRTVKVNVDTSEGQKQLGNLVDQVEIAGVSFGDLRQSIGGTTKAIGGAIKGLKGLKVALATTGIGLILVALGSLVTFLTKTQEGMDLVAKGTAAVEAAFSVLIDRSANVVKGLFNLNKAIVVLFTDGFAEAAKVASTGVDQLTDAVSGLTTELIEETKAAVELEGQRQEIERQEIALIAITAERRAELEKLRGVIDDTRNTEAERFAALEQAEALAKVRRDEQLAFFDAQIKNLQDRQELGKNTREDERELAELLKERADIEEEAAGILNGFLGQRLGLEQEIADEKERQLELQQEELDNFKKNNSVFRVERRKTADEETAFTEESNELNNQVQLNKLNNLLEENEARKKSAEEQLQFEKDLANAETQLASEVFKFAGTLVAEGSLASKAIAIALAITDALRASISTLANTPAGPIGKTLAAAAIFAQATAVVGQIRAIAVPAPKVQIQPPQFAEGGHFTIGGNLHSRGGTRFVGSDGSQFIAERGEELFILNRGATKMLSTLKEINGLGLGGSFLQTGGVVNPALDTTLDTFNQTESLLQAFERIPPPEVSVIKIARAAREVEVTRNRGTI